MPKWLLIGLLVLFVDIGLFALAGWWFMRNEEEKLNDGDPRNPYTPRDPRNTRRWWR